MNLETFINEAIAEDIGAGDFTSLSVFDAKQEGKAYLLCKEKGIIAGVDVAKKILQQIDNELHITIIIEDGTPVKVGDVVLSIAGSIQSILKAERLMLNVMQRMSGIATYTHHLCTLIAHTSARLLDTRKTTPNMRLLEKMAVQIGGGYNHRMGLYDMILLKDNHIDFAGGLKNAIESVHRYLKNKNLNLPIEVETRSLADVQKVLQIGGIERIMFDNFSVEDTYKAVEMNNHRFETETSGNISEKNIVDYAQTGVDFISVGALTHSVKSLDMSLLAEISRSKI
ncbi:MAG: carboxylating nicotinate-nucleotide diphosphorylase [Bacteroidales bacterium]|jgi:nicotinate-nucleotide pyrophosphorylase (carboxylating)|nr:carboxylating nicotinate-nucleotide diphosphorylase [Bacteroidales bacterium]